MVTQDEVLSICIAIQDCDVVQIWESKFAPSFDELSAGEKIWEQKHYSSIWRATLLYSLISLRKVADFAENRGANPDDIRLRDLGLDLQKVTGKTEIIDDALREKINKGIAHLTKNLVLDNVELVDLREQLRSKEKVIRNLGDAIFTRII